MNLPLIETSTVNTGVVAEGDLRKYRVELEVTLREAAQACGLTDVQYASLERHLVFFKDEAQWLKTKALLKQSLTREST